MLGKTLTEAPVEGETWFDCPLIVNGDQITTRINGKTAAEHTVTGQGPLKPGTIALQCHDSKSKVEFHTIRIRLLPQP